MWEVILKGLSQAYEWIKGNAILVIAICLVVCTIINLIVSWLIVVKQVKRNRNLATFKIAEEEKSVVLNSSEDSEGEHHQEEEEDEFDENIPF